MKLWLVKCVFTPRDVPGHKYGLKTGYYTVRVCFPVSEYQKLRCTFPANGPHFGGLWITTAKKFIRGSMINPTKELNRVLNSNVL